MKVIVVGAGRVGRRVAEHLSKRHDVTVVDINGRLVDELQYSLDVLAVEGDATLPDTLEEAGVYNADYVIATTNNDNVNIVVCSLAKTLSNPRTIARVKNMEYLRVWGRGREALGVDTMVCAVPLVARSIINVVEYPQIRFLRKLYGELYVGDVLSAPETLWSVEIKGRTLVIGTLDEIRKTYRAQRPQNVLIMGGSETGIFLAEMLSEKGYNVKLVERDEKRAEYASKKLDSVLVIQGDVFDQNLWRGEELNRADLGIACLGEDSHNLLASLIAVKSGVKRVFSIVHEQYFSDIFEKNGIFVVSPEIETAERIVLAIKGEHILGIVSGIPGVTVLAVEIGENLAGKKPEEVGAILGPVLREGETIIPGGNFTLRKGDIATIVVENERLGELEL